MTIDEQYTQIMTSDIPWLKLNLQVPFKTFLTELADERKLAVSQMGNKGWNGLTLHGLAADKPRPAKFYDFFDENDAPYKWTESGNRCPEVKSFLESNLSKNKWGRIKVNYLRPGAKIYPHIDSRDNHQLGVSDITSPPNYRYLTIALKWPRKCIYNVGDYNLPVQDGDVFFINFSKYHEVYNFSNIERASMIVTADFETTDMKKLIVESYNDNGEDYKKYKLNIFQKYGLRNYRRLQQRLKI